MTNKRISQLVASFALTLGVCISAEASEIKPASLRFQETAIENLQKLGTLPGSKEEDGNYLINIDRNPPTQTTTPQRRQTSTSSETSPPPKRPVPNSN